MMTRDEAREAWAMSGLSHADLTPESMEALRKAINAELSADRPIRGFCCRGKPTIRQRKDGTVGWADIRCSAYYFTDRQAVTFESHGFVGFAGWASDENVQPILRGFARWVETSAAAAFQTEEAKER